MLFGERIVKKAMGLPEDPLVVENANASIRKYGAILDRHLQDRDAVDNQRRRRKLS